MDEATMVGIIADTLKKHQPRPVFSTGDLGRRCTCDRRIIFGGMEDHRSVMVYAALRDAVIAHLVTSGAQS